MSRLGRSQPIQPFSSHGFVNPGPGPVGTTPRLPAVVENDDRRRKTLPLQPVIINGLYAVALAPTVIPPEPVVSVPPVRPREWLRQPVVAHGFDDAAPQASQVFEPEDRRRRYWPLPPISISGVLASFLQLFVSPPPPVVVDVPRDRGRYRPLDPISISAALNSVTAAPAPVPPGPFVVPLEERRRFLAALPPTVTHGFEDATPQTSEVFEPEDRRRRYQPLQPLAISGVLAPFFPPFAQPPAPLVVFVDGRNRRLVLQPIVLAGPPPESVPAPVVTESFDRRRYAAGAYDRPTPTGA